MYTVREQVDKNLTIPLLDGNERGRTQNRKLSEALVHRQLPRRSFSI